MIAESEFKAIPVKGLLKANDESARLKFIPFAGSQWVRSHLHAAFATMEAETSGGSNTSKPNTRQLCASLSSFLY